MDRYLVKPQPNVFSGSQGWAPSFSAGNGILPASLGFQQPLYSPNGGGMGLSKTGMGYMPASYRTNHPYQYIGPDQRAALRMQEAQAQLGSGPGTAQPGAWGDSSDSTAGLPSVDRWTAQINSALTKAQQKYGIAPPASLVKAMMHLESGGNPLAASPAGYYGLMQVGAGSSGVGTDFDLGRAMVDPEYNIYAGVVELILKYRDGTASVGWAKNWDNAVRLYHGIGSDGYTTDTEYLDIVKANQAKYITGSIGGAGMGYNPQQINGQWGGTYQGNDIVKIASQYVGVAYVWGGAPGKGVDPWKYSMGGWDCSGFTWWLDQNYGDGSLPQGSHYQYEYLMNRGRVTTDMNQLQVGDLLFFDTGWQGGGGAERNNAGHVGMYIGNGQMIHAANPSVGTVIVNLGDFLNGGAKWLGAGKVSWSGEGSPYTGAYSYGNPQAASARPTMGVGKLPMSLGSISPGQLWGKRWF